MHHRFFIAAFILGALTVSASPAKADFLGLPPGDYIVTLNGSTTLSLCGASNCTGTLHIGPTGASGFDWDFIVGGDIFQFDGPTTATSISPDTLTSCALEINNSNTGGGCQAFDDGTTTIAAPFAPNFAMDYLETVGPRWFYVGSISSGRGTWDASPIAVPEPLSGSLLVFGLGALSLRRWLRSKQN